MAPKKNDNKHKIITPEGTFVWPHLNEPDYGNEKVQTPNGQYSVTLRLQTSDGKVKKFLARLDELMQLAKEQAEEEIEQWSKDAKAKLKESGGITPDLPYSKVYDKETGESTGEVDFNAKMTASGVRSKTKVPWKQKPGLFDAKNKPIPKGTEIWGGSTGRVSCSLKPYFISGTKKYGLSRRLEAAQILSLVTSGQARPASSYGFDEQEGFDSSELLKDEDDTANEAHIEENEYDEDDAAAF